MWKNEMGSSIIQHVKGHFYLEEHFLFHLSTHTHTNFDLWLTTDSIPLLLKNNKYGDVKTTDHVIINIKKLEHDQEPCACNTLGTIEADK